MLEQIIVFPTHLVKPPSRPPLPEIPALEMLKMEPQPQTVLTSDPLEQDARLNGIGFIDAQVKRFGTPAVRRALAGDETVLDLAARRALARLRDRFGDLDVSIWINYAAALYGDGGQ